MKLRNFIIVLLAVLMAFAFASCKNDPEPTPPGPTPPGPTGDVYQFQVTQGIDVEHKAYSYDKLKLVWEEEVNEGDTLSLKYRSERGIYQWDIRDAYKWVYETHKNGFVDPVLGEDGWYTLTYTFPATDYQGAEVEYPQTSFGVFFRGWFLTGDLFEIKDVTINGQALDAPKITSSGQLNDPAVEHDWTKKDCAVLFFVSDGDVPAEGGVVKLQSGTTLQEKDLPKQEGSILKLYADAAHTTEFALGTPITSDTRLYYEFVSTTHTVKFNTNGGVPEIADQTVNDGSPITVPENPTKIGAVFAAWCTDEALETEWDVTAPVTSDMTLYAKYTPLLVYTVKFNTNGGSPATIEDQTVLSGSAIVAPENPTKEGAVFAAWCTDEALTIVWDVTAPVTSDMTLYAKYNALVYYTVKFNTNGGTPATIPDQTVLNGTPIVAPENPTKEGKLFKAWCTDAELKTVWDVTAPVTADMTLYAAYDDAVKVTFKSNGGAFPDGKENLEVTIVKGTAVEKPTDPAKKDVYFAGWFTDEALTKAYDFATLVNADLTLYAKWSLGATVTLVKFDREHNKTLDVAINKTMDEPAVEAIEGYEFLGWYDDAEFKFLHDFEEEVTGDFTIYANWIAMYRATSLNYTSKDGNKYDKFILSLPNAAMKPGDEISVTFRTTEPFTQYSIRRFSDNKKFFHEKSSGTYPKFFSTMTTEDGWTTVSYVFPAEGAATQDAAAAVYPRDPVTEEILGVGFNIYFRNQKMVPGAFMEVKSVTITRAGETEAVEQALDYSNFNPSGSLGNVETDFMYVLEPYKWEEHTVSFNTDGGTEIEDVKVDFGRYVERPEDPIKDKVLFYDWYSDAKLTEEFSFDTPIIKDTTIYAKYTAPVTITFNSNGGSEVASQTIASGRCAVEPEEPTYVGKVFSCWCIDSACTEPYDFGAAVEKDTTLYAAWLDSYKVTLDLNDGTGETKIVYAPQTTGEIPADTIQVGRPGFYLDGWYDAATGGTKVEKVTSDCTLYAHWATPTDYYKYTLSDPIDDYGHESAERVQFRWKSSSYVPTDVKAGDTITFMVSSSAGLKKVRFRAVKKNYDISVTISDYVEGWTPVTLTLPDDYSGTDGFTVMIYEAADAKAGDVVAISALAFNGNSIPITTDSSSGLYPSADSDGCYGPKATMDVVPIDN